LVVNVLDSDIVGDKLMEINVFTPGGFGSAQLFEKANFSQAVLESLQHKIDYKACHRRNVSNVQLATV